MATLKELENRVNNLEQSFIQAMKNQTLVVSKVDETKNNVNAITPYVESKIAFIGDTEVLFDNVKNGNLSVSVRDSDGNYIDYKVESILEGIRVVFKPLETIATITISVL